MQIQWVARLAGFAVLISTAAAVAQDAPGRVDVARYPALGQPAEALTVLSRRAGTAADAIIAGTQADDSQPGLVENGWDFSRPETIPGFGPWQPTSGTPEVKRAGAE